LNFLCLPNFSSHLKEPFCFQFRNQPQTLNNPSSLDDDVQVISQTSLKNPFSVSVGTSNNSLLNRSLSGQSLLNSMYSNAAQGAFQLPGNEKVPWKMLNL